MILRRKSRRDAISDQGALDDVLAEIEEVTRDNCSRRSSAAERRLLELRHRAGMMMLEAAADEAAPDAHAPGQQPRSGLAEVTAADLSADVLRAAIVSNGSLLVRGLVDGERAAGLGTLAAEVFEARDRTRTADGLYEEFEPDPRFRGLFERAWVASFGSIWLADSPRMLFATLEALEDSGLRPVLTEYLGGRPVLSVNKSGLRRATPESAAAWHQDGAFLGEVRTVNLWLALTRCGDEAPGLEFVPRRLTEIVPTGTDGAMFEWSVSPRGGGGGGR